MDFHTPIAPKGRVLIKMDTRQKERYSFANGKTIHIEKGFDFNKRIDKPSMAVIIHGENLPSGEEILVHHNSTDPTYEVFDEDILTQQQRLDGYKILSLPEDMCFVYSDNGEWHPCKDFLITERIFKPYKGNLVGIEHEQIKNRMYVCKGEWEGNVVITTLNCDYEIIWHNKINREQRLIRTRHREVLAIDHGTTKDVKNGKLLIGLNPQDAKIFINNKTYNYATSKRIRSGNYFQKY